MISFRCKQIEKYWREEIPNEWIDINYVIDMENELSDYYKNEMHTNETTKLSAKLNQSKSLLKTSFNNELSTNEYLRWFEHILLPLQVDVLFNLTTKDPIKYGAYYFPKRRYLEILRENTNQENIRRGDRIELLFDIVDNKLRNR
jgi:hypothetical protein